MNTIPIEVKKKCVELSKEGYTSTQVYNDYYSKEFDTSYNSFRGMLKKWKKKIEVDDGILETANLGYGFVPHDATVQIGKDGTITQSWIKSKASDFLYLELIENIKKMPEFPPVQKREIDPIDRMLEITYDDMHFGVATFEDYTPTLQDTLYYIERYQYKEINIIIGEDLLHTDDLKGHTSNGTYIGEVNVPKAYNDCLRFYFALMDSALKHSERVRATYSMGNHSETLSWTIVQVLKIKYPQAEYEDSLEPRKVITYGNIFIGVTHGETIPKNLSQVKELFVEEFMSEYASARIKEIHIGHLHKEVLTGDVNGCVVRRLSTGVPKDKWHIKNGYTMAVKRFMLFEYSSDALISIHYV